MHEEKNVCIAGSYLEKKTRKIIGEIETDRQQIYYWGFEKIKTMKGCEAYHRNGCHMVSTASELKLNNISNFGPNFLTHFSLKIYLYTVNGI